MEVGGLLTISFGAIHLRELALYVCVCEKESDKERERENERGEYIIKKRNGCFAKECLHNI